MKSKKDLSVMVFENNEWREKSKVELDQFYLIEEVIAPIREYNGKKKSVIGRIRGEIAQILFQKNFDVETVMEFTGLKKSQAYEYRKRLILKKTSINGDRKRT